MTTEATDHELTPDSLAERLISEIRADPRVRQLVLRALLTEEFLVMPARLEQLAGDFHEFREATDERFRQVDRRFDRVEDRLGSVEDRLGGVEGRLESVEGRLDTMQGSINGLRGDFNSLRGTLDNMRGNSYEERCSNNLRIILSEHFVDLTVLDRAEFQDALLAARRSGRINRAELVDANHTDIVCQGRWAEDGQHTVGVVEASITMNQDDVDTARRRANILRRVLDGQIQAFVVSHVIWSDSLAEYADNSGVALVQHEEAGLAL